MPAFYWKSIGEFLVSGEPLSSAAGSFFHVPAPPGFLFASAVFPLGNQAGAGYWVRVLSKFKCVPKSTAMHFRSAYDAAEVESSLFEAGGRHDNEPGNKMCAPRLHLRGDHWQVLQCRL
jgi:hypothetical protein